MTAPVDVYAEAEKRYNEAAKRLRLVRREWVKLGRPLTCPGSRGQVIEHPMMKMLRDLESTCDRLAVPLQKRHAGPEPSAVVQAAVGASPAARLRENGSKS